MASPLVVRSHQCANVLLADDDTWLMETTRHAISSDHFAENDVWSLRTICEQRIVLLNVIVADLTEVSSFRSSLFRRSAPAVAPDDSYPRFRPVKDFTEHIVS